MDVYLTLSEKRSKKKETFQKMSPRYWYENRMDISSNLGPSVRPCQELGHPNVIQCKSTCKAIIALTPSRGINFGCFFGGAHNKPDGFFDGVGGDFFKPKR